jgi:hypothetical protein
VTNPGPEKCEPGGDYCGTPTGWRRCRRCRTAHNADLRNSRGLTRQQRDHVLLLLRAGRNADQATASAGVTKTSVSVASTSDGELRAALDGYPEAIQKAARLGDYLAALIRTGGDIPLAVQVSKIPNFRALDNYRRTGPLFAAAEQAILQWVDQTTKRTTGRIPDDLLDRAASILEKDPDVTLASVARAIGVANGVTLRKAARRHARLRAALPAARATDRPLAFTPEKDQLLRDLWPDRTRSRKDIAGSLGVSESSLDARVKHLGLPSRLTFRTGRRGIPATRNTPDNTPPTLEDPACPPNPRT